MEKSFEELVEQLSSVREQIKRLRQKDSTISQTIIKGWLAGYADAIKEAGAEVIARKGSIQPTIVGLLKERGLGNCIMEVPIPEAISRMVDAGVITEEEVDEHRSRTVLVCRLRSDQVGD